MSDLERAFREFLGDQFVPYVGREEGSPLPNVVRERREQERRRREEERRRAREEKALAELSKRKKSEMSFGELAKAVCSAYGVTFESILADDRTLTFFVPRSHLMWLSRNHLGLRWVEIARLMKRDHGTVMSGTKAFEKRFANSPLAQELHRVLERISRVSDPDT